MDSICIGIVRSESCFQFECNLHLRIGAKNQFEGTIQSKKTYENFWLSSLRWKSKYDLIVVIFDWLANDNWIETWFFSQKLFFFRYVPSRDRIDCFRECKVLTLLYLCVRVLSNLMLWFNLWPTVTLFSNSSSLN